MKIIRAKTMVELKAKIYKANNWVRVAGESQMARIQEKYKVTLNLNTNTFDAVLKD